MNVVREDIDALNAILKVQVKPEDYQDKVKETLKNHRKKVNLPGFRPGMVPMGLIQKQYGSSVLAEELNRVVNASLQSYLAENKVEILGNPIPKQDHEVEGDFKNPSEFTFAYEIGLAPTVDVKLSSKSKYDYLKVKIDDTLVDKQIEDLRRRYGKLTTSDKVGDTDLVMAQFVELNDDDSIKEGGILHSSTVSMEFISNDKVKKDLKGKEVGYKIIVNPTDVSRGGKDTAAMLGVKEEELEGLSDKFQLMITEIKGMEMAELNEELFDKLFGAGAVKNEKDMRERVVSDLAGMFMNDSDRMLTQSIYKDLLEKTKVDLPDAFLKRWIKISNEKDVTAEQIEADYENYSKSLKWQLIQGNIFKANDIKLEDKEVIEYTKGLLASNYAQYGMPAPEDAELTKSAMEVLQNREEANRVYEMLAERKLTHYFKETVSLKDKEISYDEFVELAGAQK
ncbi:MAG: trigger factor [Crocinitomicaceae bacterium]|nr:trigger factor [Flavobacteriales bacterium]NQZ38037.1 trigger factor [Crocinitomicaceae bacterium]